MSYGVEWILGAGLLGTVLVLLVVPSFALIGLVVVVHAALATLGAFVRAILAIPYLLVRPRVGASRSGASQAKARSRIVTASAPPAVPSHRPEAGLIAAR